MGVRAMSWLWRPRRPRILMVGRYGRCRAPMAELILRHKLAEGGTPRLLQVQSAATHLLPARPALDPRAARVLARQGVIDGPVKPRQLRPRDLEDQDWLLAMDRKTLEHLRGLGAFTGLDSRVRLITDYPLRYRWEEVPDPYFSNEEGFVRVYGMLERSVEAFLMDFLVCPRWGDDAVREPRRRYGRLRL